MPQKNKHDKTPPRPEPPAQPQVDPRDRREVRVEADDRTLEEAGYGYGV